MTKDEAITNLIQELESVANFMRGMRLDPTVPMHTKDALEVRVGVLDELTESMLEQSYEDALQAAPNAKETN